MNKNDLFKKYTRNSPLKWKEIGFAMLPTKLLGDDRLSKACLIVFWVLTVHLFRGKEYCFPSMETIAKEAHATKPTIIKAIKDLEKCGYLEVERTFGRNNKYYLKVVK